MGKEMKRRSKNGRPNNDGTDRSNESSGDEIEQNKYNMGKLERDSLKDQRQENEKGKSDTEEQKPKNVENQRRQVTTDNNASDEEQDVPKEPSTSGHIPSKVKQKKSEPQKGKPNGKPEENSSSQQSIFHLSCRQTVLLVVVTICAISMVWPSQVSTKSNLQAQFFEEIHAIVQMLKNTNSNLLYVNKSLTVFVKEGSHEKPAIVLLLSTNSSSCSLCHILSKFIDALCNFYAQEHPVPNEGYIKAEDVRSRNENDGKIYIDENIHNVVKKENHLVILEDIDKFPVSSLPKVHSYLDHENAPHKDMVYILTGVTPDDQGEFEVGKYKELIKIATHHFDEQWSNYDEDHRRAVMGRISSVIGFIHQAKIPNRSEMKENSCKQKCEL